MNGSNEIRKLLGEINDAWTSGHAEELPAALDRCFHERIVFRGPDLRELARGKQACIRSYEDFVRNAKVLGWEFSDPLINMCGDTAVATYDWNVSYEMNGHEQRESGHDLFVFSRESGQWLAVWRAVLMCRP